MSIDIACDIMYMYVLSRSIMNLSSDKKKKKSIEKRETPHDWWYGSFPERSNGAIAHPRYSLQGM